MKQLAGASPLVLLWALPLLAGLFAMLPAAADGQVWASLLSHPQLWPSLALSVLIGSLSTGLALVAAILIAAGSYRTRFWNRMPAVAAGGLAIPHLAFAIGFGFLVMPAGWLARLVVGGDAPPAWITVQDPWGLSLIAALVLKEIPFLLAMIWSILSRGDVASGLDGQWRAARSLGHAPGSIWLRVILPQLLGRLVWPIVIVWVYGATVVDMALVIGPTQPPTMAVIIWRDLNNAEAAVNSRGAAGALCLTLALVVMAALFAIAGQAICRVMRSGYGQGPSLRLVPRWISAFLTGATALTYILTLAVLMLMSLAPRWPYPALWPEALRTTAWHLLGADPAPILLSLGLGLIVSLVAVGLVVVWLETQPEHSDRLVIALALGALGLPQLLTAAGEYRLLLHLGLSGTLPGLFLVHLTPAMAYVAIVLVGPYRALDPRYAGAARSLGARPVRLWWRVKVPLLWAPLLMAAAVGFSVSLVQFVPAQLIAAGRFTTLPMDAVTISSGGNRALAAVYALALSVPSLVAFALAALLGRPRWR